MVTMSHNFQKSLFILNILGKNGNGLTTVDIKLRLMGADKWLKTKVLHKLKFDMMMVLDES